MDKSSPDEHADTPDADRPAATDEHRRRLEECEQGVRECALRKPVAPRDRKRLRRRMLLLAVGVLIAAAVAVPVILAVARSAAERAGAGIDKVDRTLDSIQRAEGYLQRDEQRELESTGR